MRVLLVLAGALARVLSMSDQDCHALLFQGYNRLMPPSNNNFTGEGEGDGKIVSFELYTSLITSVDEKNSMLSFSTTSQMSWFDDRIVLSKCGDIPYLPSRAGAVWIPGVRGLYGVSPIVQDSASITIFPNGRIVVKTTAAFPQYCLINVRRFPVDSTRCRLQFALDDHGWKFRGIKNKRTLVQGLPNFQLEDDCDKCGLMDKEPIPDETESDVLKPEYMVEDILNYGFVMHRRSKLWIFNVIIPSAMQTFLAILMLFCCGRGQFVGICGGTFIAVTPSITNTADLLITNLALSESLSAIALNIGLENILIFSCFIVRGVIELLPLVKETEQKKEEKKEEKRRGDAEPKGTTKVAMLPPKDGTAIRMDDLNAKPVETAPKAEEAIPWYRVHAEKKWEMRMWSMGFAMFGLALTFTP